MKILVTGSAGFIGANLVMRLLKTPDQVGGDVKDVGGDVKDVGGDIRSIGRGDGLTIVGLDNMNDYYDVSLKEYRLRRIEEKVKKISPRTSFGRNDNKKIEYEFVRGSIADKTLVDRLFEEHKFDIVVNLAAQAGVRYSIENPDVYIESNIIGFYNILEACRRSLDYARDDKDGYQGVRHLVYKKHYLQYL